MEAAFGKETLAYCRKLPEIQWAPLQVLIKGAQSQFGLQDISLEKIEKSDSVLTKVAYLMNHYLVGYYRLYILKANLWIWKLHTIN